MGEDKEFWSALNEGWKKEDFELSYSTPKFKFSDDRVVERLFGVEFAGPKETLEIKDFMN